MATDIAGLFGITPQLYEQQLRQSALNEGIGMAKLAPEDRAQAMIYSAGAGLGRAGGGLLGAIDPQMQLISARQQIINQVDQSNPASMMDAVKQLTAIGDTQGALYYSEYARKAASEIAQAQQHIAQANRERQQAIPPDILKAETEANLKANIRKLASYEQTPDVVEQVNMLQDRLSALTRTKETAPNVKTVGVAVSSKKPVYLDVNSDQQFTYETGQDGKQIRVPYVGQVDRAVSSSNVNLPPQEKAFESGLGTGQSKMILENKAAAVDAASILETNLVAKNLLKSGVITGTGANFLVGLNNALKQVGIDFGYADAAANSQAYMAAMGANVGRLVKQFGAGTGISNSDREYAEKIAGGQISLTEDALRKIIDINDRAANRVIDLHNKNVMGIKTNIPLTVEKPVMTQTPKSAVEQIPSQQGALNAPMYARNPETNERIMSLDGGKTWKPAR